MKKYIFTEEQIKKVIDSVVSEQQMSPEDKFAKNQQASFNAVYANPPITQQMRKYPQGTKFGFSPAKAAEISKMSKSNVLYQVKPGDTISGIVQKMGANSEYNILGDNDLLKNNPKAIQPGMVITFSLLPSGN